MNDDELRRALASYAAAAPDTDPRAALPATLARRERMRRTAVASVACLAALVAGTGVATLTRDAGGSDRLVVADDPSPEPTEVPAEPPVETATPSPEPSPTDPRPTRAPTREPSPTPSRAPSPTATTPPAPPADGLRVTLALDPGDPVTATRATLTVRAEDGDGYPQVTEVAWGDGSVEHIPIAMPSCAYDPGPHPTPRPAEPGSSTRTFQHAWRHDGAFTVSVKVYSETSCTHDPAPIENETERLSVTVLAGEVTSNGPARAVVDGLEQNYLEQDPELMARISAGLQDRDGYVRTATIDWGDGSEPETWENDEPCEDGDGRYYPTAGGSGLATEHTYAEAGTYVVTVTMTSTGCDGEDAQRDSADFEVVVPYEPPPDS